MDSKYKFLTLKYALINASFMFMICATVGYGYNFLSQSGFADGTVGIIITAVSICGLIGQTLSGSVIDKSQKLDEKKFLSFAMVCVVALAVLLALMPEGSIGMIVMTLLCFTSASIGMPILNSLAFVYENDGQKINYGLCRGIGSAAWAIGSSLIGQLWGMMGRKILPWYVVAFAVVSFLLVQWMPSPSREASDVIENDPGEGKPAKGLSYVAFFKKYKKIIPVLAALVLLYFCHMMINTYMAKIVGNMLGSAAGTPGAVESVQGNFLFIAAMVELPTMFLFSKIIEKISIQKVMVIASVIWSIKHALTWLCPNVYIFYGIAVLQMFAYAAMAPAIVYFANQSVEELDRNKSQAVFAASNTVGNLLSSLVGGQLFQFMNVPNVIMIGVIASIIGTILMAIGIKTQKVV